MMAVVAVSGTDAPPAVPALSELDAIPEFCISTGGGNQGLSQTDIIIIAAAGGGGLLLIVAAVAALRYRRGRAAGTGIVLEKAGGVPAL